MHGSNTSMANAFKQQGLLNSAYGLIERETDSIVRNKVANAGKTYEQLDMDQVYKDAREQAIKNISKLPGMSGLLNINPEPSEPVNPKPTVNPASAKPVQPTMGTFANPLPMTSRNPKDYVVGKYYNTAKGPAKWDGSGFDLGQ
jgi:hypothetical protein